MEYIKTKNIISKLIKIGIIIVLVVAFSPIAFFAIRALFSIAVFGVLVWSTLKLVNGLKRFIYKISTKGNSASQNDVFSSDDTHTSDPTGINYDDSPVIDVDYEKVE